MATATHNTINVSRNVSCLLGQVTRRSSPTTSPNILKLNARRAASVPILRVSPGSRATATSPLDALCEPGTSGSTS